MSRKIYNSGGHIIKKLQNPVVLSTIYITYVWKFSFWIHTFTFYIPVNAYFSIVYKVFQNKKKECVHHMHKERMQRPITSTYLMLQFYFRSLFRFTFFVSVWKSKKERLTFHNSTCGSLKQGHPFTFISTKRRERERERERELERPIQKLLPQCCS